MFGEQQVRTLLEPADPVRRTTVAPPRLSAYDLIALAEATAAPVARPRYARPTRRLVLTAGAMAVAVAVAATTVAYETSIVDRSPTNAPPDALGPVLVPIAYEFPTAAQPAGPQLRALAGRIGNAPYENHTGRYTYHHFKTWGDPVMTSADGRHHMALADETRMWEAADGTGRQVTTQLERQFPDEQSRVYWARHLEAASVGSSSSLDLPAVRQIAPLPADRAGLAELLKVQYGAGAVNKEVGTVYGRYAVPRPARAEILRILADIPGFLWRGNVTDRAGRPGLAITFDDREHDQQHLLIFDPKTGELLAHELLTLVPVRISTYLMYLGTDRTDKVG